MKLLSLATRGEPANDQAMRRAYRTDNRDDGFVEPPRQPDDQPAPPRAEWTKRELLEAGSLSPNTFDTIRKAARVRGPSHGGLNHLFSPTDVIALIAKCESGSFTERGGPPAAAWRTLLETAGVKAPERAKRRGQR